MRSNSLRPQPIAHRALVSPSLSRARTRNLAFQTPQPPKPHPTPRSRPYTAPPQIPASAPQPGHASSPAPSPRKPGSLPAGYKAAERRSVLSSLTLSLLQRLSFFRFLGLFPFPYNPSASLNSHPIFPQPHNSLHPCPLTPSPFRVLAAMVALPILLVTSYVLYRRCTSPPLPSSLPSSHPPLHPLLLVWPVAES